jgi:ribonuclease E
MENTSMSTRMLIDASHTEETRVAVVRGNRIDEFDFEAANKKQLRGNIYLARVTRVEPSLQAAFVEYGGNRHGFLAFSEIHPDYYQIPTEDRDALIAEEAESRASSAAADDAQDAQPDQNDDSEDAPSPEVEEVGADDTLGDAEKARSSSPNRRYKIQEVIKRRQILLIQVVKEERGNKGAALTTYLSLAGRHCVLMPNTARGGGVSRKIATYTDRKRLKKILSDLEVPGGMGCIIRTAGANRTKTEIKRDYTYLLRQWDSIRELTLGSTAPVLIHEEGNLIKRTMRDVYSSEIDEVLVEGNAGYRTAKDFIKMMMPSHARKVQQYKEDIPLFHRFQVETQLETMFSTTVTLKSGGYLVINPTEALISIDVNSGKSTKERNIERTAHKTNLEAAEEVARQLRLRDLAGLIVIDFIDMDESRNNRAVERKMKECLKTDRARLQVGRISAFGLMEMSRQRMRPGMLEITSNPCPVCEGSGNLRTTESSALQVLRAIEGEGIHSRGRHLRVSVPTDVALYILNHKRREFGEIEDRYNITVNMMGDDAMHRPHYDIKREGPAHSGDDVVYEPSTDNDDAKQETKETAEPRQNERGGRRNQRNRRNKDEDRKDEGRDNSAETDAGSANQNRPEADASEDGQEEGGRRRRRGKRGGRRRRRSSSDAEAQTNAADVAEKSVAPGSEDQPELDAAASAVDVSTDPIIEPAAENEPAAAIEAAPEETVATAESTEATAAPSKTAETEEAKPDEEKKPARRPRTRRKRAAPKSDDKAKDTSDQAVAEQPEVAAEAAPAAVSEPAPEPVAVKVEAPASAAAEPESPPAAAEPAAAKPAVTEPERPKGPPRAGWWNKATD